MKSHHPYQLGSLVGRFNSRIFKRIVESGGQVAATIVFWAIGVMDTLPLSTSQAGWLCPTVR